MRELTIDLPTPDGQMQTFICHPERCGPHPAVFFLMDAPGIREELRDMARRLATSGYYVLLPNLYYRHGRDTIYGPDVMKEGSVERERILATGMREEAPAPCSRQRSSTLPDPPQATATSLCESRTPGCRAAHRPVPRRTSTRARHIKPESPPASGAARG